MPQPRDIAFMTFMGVVVWVIWLAFRRMHKIGEEPPPSRKTDAGAGSSAAGDEKKP